MDKFLTEEGLNMISVLLVLAVAGYVFCGWLAAKLERDDALWMAANEMGTEPKGFEPDPVHIASILEAYGLRNDLPAHRNMNGAAQADIVDLKRGTSDNVLRYLP